LLSDKLLGLVTESESKAFVVSDFVAFEQVVLHLIVWVLVEADVTVDLNVEINPVDNKLSWILAIIDAGVMDPDISNSSLVSGNIKSVLYVSMFVISRSAFIATHKDFVSHHASWVRSIAPSVKNLWNFVVLIVPSQSPVKNTNKPATTSLACWPWLGWNQKMNPSWLYILFTAWNNLLAS